MTVKINYKNISFKKISHNLVLFTDDKFSLSPLKRYISKLEYFYVNDLLKTSDLKKNLLIFELNSKKKNRFSFSKKRYYFFKCRKFRSRVL